MKFKEAYMYILGAIVVLGFICLGIFLIMSGKYEAAVNLMIGSVISSFTLVLGYFYGSSKGSADKTEAINKKLDAA
jgi:hypothetical protein